MAAINSVALSIPNLIHTRRIFREDPTLQMAACVLRHHLFSSGIDFQLDPKLTRKRKREQTEAEQVRWTVFLERALEEILCWGFVVFHEDLSEVDLSRCSVFMDRDTREIKVKHHKKPVYTINAFGYSPAFEGRLTSVVNSLVPWVEFIMRLRDSVLTLEDKKVFPDMIYEKLPKKEAEEAIIGREYYADADDMGRRSEQQYTISAEEREAFRRGRQKDIREITRLCGSVDQSDTLTVPEGHKLAHIGTAQGRSDIVGIMRLVQQIICATVGVPRTMLINDSVARADTQATHTRFRSTLKVYKRHLNHVLTVAYNMIHTDSYVIGKLKDVFYGPPETLTQMWLMGIIDDTQYREHFAQMYGVTTTGVNVDVDKQALVTDVMRNLVTQHHGRT